MRKSHLIASSLFALSLALGASACGGSMAEISREDRAREDSALLARGHHDDVVRLVGDSEGGAMDPAECPTMCMRRSRVSDLANRICIMSARPGRILEDRAVPFDRPRTLEMSYAPEFAALVQQLRMRIAKARQDGDEVDSGSTVTEVAA